VGITLQGAPLAKDAHVVTEFPLPGIALPLALAARVVWADPESDRAGLLFDDVDPGLSELLASYVNGRLGR
jgi:hypothetical protein